MGVNYKAVLFVGREFEDQYDAQYFFEKYFSISEEDIEYIKENGFLDYCCGLENGLRGEILNYYSGGGFVLGIDIGACVRKPESFSEDVKSAINKWKELFGEEEYDIIHTVRVS